MGLGFGYTNFFPTTRTTALLGRCSVHTTDALKYALGEGGWKGESWGGSNTSGIKEQTFLLQMLKSDVKKALEYFQDSCWTNKQLTFVRSNAKGFCAKTFTLFHL